MNFIVNIRGTFLQNNMKTTKTKLQYSQFLDMIKLKRIDLKDLWLSKSKLLTLDDDDDDV